MSEVRAGPDATWGELLNTARRLATGRTHSEIAAALGVQRPTVTQMFAGRRGTLALLLRFLEEEGVRVERGEDGEPVIRYRVEHAPVG